MRLWAKRFMEREKAENAEKEREWHLLLYGEGEKA